MEFTQIVTVQATNDNEIGRKVRAIKAIAAESIDEPSPAATESLTKTMGSPVEIIVPGVPGPSPTPARIPYFDIGDADGAPGETVEVEVEAGCIHLMTGFHIAGGLSSYGKFKPVRAILGPYLGEYLAGARVFEKFQFVDSKLKALPEEWWEFAVGFFSLDDRKTFQAIAIPGGTHLFTLEIKILAGTPPGKSKLTCEDEHYYTHFHQKRRDLMFTADRDSPFARGGITEIETFGGVLTVT